MTLSALTRAGQSLQGVVHEGEATGHARSEIVTDRTQYHGDTTGHVLAAIVPATLDDRDGSGIANCEPVTGLTRDEQRSSCRAI